MASGAFSRGVLNILNGAIDLDTTTLKLMALKSSYSFDPDHDQVSDLSEISGVSGYTAGYGGAGRKTLTVTLAEQVASNRVVTRFGDLTWTALGAGDTIGGFAVIYETGGADTSAIPLFFFDVADTPTNGGDITVDFDPTDGNVRWTV